MYVIINGVSSDTIQGLQVLSLPPITKPKMRRQVDTIDGRAGDIITELGYEAYDRTITVLLHHTYDLDAITAFFNTSGEIIFSNEPDKKYYFRLLEKIDYERAVQFKTANVTFHVQPYKYPVNETPLTVSTTAWEGTDYDQTPYIFRAVSDSSVEVGNREIVEQITGGTVAWNQLLSTSKIRSTATINGVTFTNNGDGTVTVNGTATANAAWYITGAYSSSNLAMNGKILIVGCPSGGSASTYSIGVRGVSGTTYDWKRDYGSGCICSATDKIDNYSITVQNGATVNNLTFKPQVVNLTQLFGSTIADYIYSLETATAGAGVSLFKSLFPNDYYPYNAGELMSVKTSAHKTYDVDDNALGTYPLSNIELRGIPKLVNNKIQYDGDVYKADGSVTIRFGIVTIDENSSIGQQTANDTRFYFARNDMVRLNNYIGHIMSNKLPAINNHGYADVPMVSGFGGSAYQGQNWIYFSNGESKTVADMKTWLASNPLTVVYELATPTTESTTPYTETQICSPYGTEEFIDDRDVQVPAGHKTKYKQINDPAEITVPNAGNVPSAPTIQLTGSGTAGVHLGNAQTLQVNIPEDGITIDTEAQDATSNGQLANRSVTGDYDSVRLQPGDNDVSFSGDVSAVITKYTRWV